MYEFASYILPGQKYLNIFSVESVNRKLIFSVACTSLLVCLFQVKSNIIEFVKTSYDSPSKKLVRHLLNNACVCIISLYI